MEINRLEGAFQDFEEMFELKGFGKDGSEKVFDKFLAACRKRAVRPKNLIIADEARTRLYKVTSLLDTLLRKDSCKYSLRIQYDEAWPKRISLVVKTDPFAVNANDYQIFKDLVNMTDGFSVLPMADGNRVLLYFGLNNIVTEVKE